MTVAITPSAWNPLEVGGEFRVYVSSDRNANRKYDKPSWVYDPRWDVEGIELVSGETPSSCVIVMAFRGTGPLSASTGMVLGKGVNNLGQTDAQILHPDGLFMYDQVMVTQVVAADPAPEQDPDGAGDPGESPGEVPGQTEKVRFRGVVVNYSEDLASGVARVLCNDDRFLMSRMPLFGVNVMSALVDSAGEDSYQWTSAVLPVFNQDGKPDRAEPSHEAFTHRGAAAAAITRPHDAAYWSPGHIWNYIRYHWQVKANSEIPFSLAGVVEMPELSPEGRGSAMFGTETTWPAFSYGGQGLNKVLAALARRRGNHDVSMEYYRDTSLLFVYGTGASTISPFQRRVTLRRGEIGTKASDSDGRPEIIGGRLAYDGRRAFSRVRGLGARKRYDLSFETQSAPGGTLQFGWKNADFLSLMTHLGSNADDGTQYPSVLTRYMISEVLDWPEQFGPGISMQMLFSRPLGTTLYSEDLTTAQADGRGVRIRALAWYSINGSDWIDVPKQTPMTAIHDGLGVQFGFGARAGENAWSWDKDVADPTVRDLRITVSVEVDERLESLSGFGDPKGWPPMERVLQDEKFIYSARRLAWVNADLTTNLPLLDGGTPLLTAQSDDEVIRDDTDRLSEAVVKLHDQLARLSMAGTIVLRGARADLLPGDYIEKVIGGGQDGDRPDWPVGAVIRRVSIKMDRTTLFLEAD